MRNRRAALAAALVSFAVLAASCTSSGDAGNPAAAPGGTTSGGARSGGAATGGTTPARTGNHPKVDPSQPTTKASFVVTPGVQHVVVTEAEPRTKLTLVDADGAKLLTAVADDEGQAAFSYLPADYQTIDVTSITPVPTDGGSTLKLGDGFTVRTEEGTPAQVSDPFRVLAIDDHPPTELYERQTLPTMPWALIGNKPVEGHDNLDGFGYIEVRDGTRLSATVRLPDPSIYGDGPFPTVVEYSGYSPSNPYSPEPGTLIANALGFATVAVNMRGTGCSGGVFDTFSPAQQADGYDLIETIARQPWVLHHKVGMIGLSYSGISQLYVASTRPPSLAAVTSSSVIADGWGEVWPGGLFNDGFTKQWLAERDRSAAPNGQSWTDKVVAAGDTVCEENQHLRKQNIPFELLYHALAKRPADAAERDLRELVKKIEVPVYLTGAWTDEQTGGQFADMVENFTAAPARKITMYNGRHPDGYTPLVLTRWYEWQMFYVARRVPRLPALVRAGAPALFEDNFKVKDLAFEPDRFAEFTDDQFDAALARYEAEKPIRILYENGAGRADVPGAPVARFEASFDHFPPPEVTPTRWYFGEGGALVTERPTTTGVDTYRHDPTARDKAYSTSGAYDFLYPDIEYDWPSDAPGTALSYLTPPFAEDVTLAGPGYADLWFRSDAASTPVGDADIEVVVTLVQPDGTEWLVQNGLLRAGHRKVDEANSTDLRIAHTFAAADYAKLPVGELTEVKVPITPVSQVFRKGTRLRIIVNTPGKDTPLWAFENLDYAGQEITNAVARGGEQASSVVLPVLPAGAVRPADGFPPCPSLRGQICRPYVELANPSGS